MSSTAGTESGPEPQGQPKRSVRPPVKVACTSCRASRTRCDGQHPTCNNCLIRGKECRYLKSNRGGPRISRKKALLAEEERRRAENAAHPDFIQSDDINWPSLMLSSEELHDELIGSMIAPGAGLVDLDDPAATDQIFDSIFVDAPPESTMFNSVDEGIPFVPYIPIHRHYTDNHAILNAYYSFIHPYFPILPAPQTNLEVDDPAAVSNGFEPVSPLALALLAILVLIPHPDDIYPDSDESICHRRQKAHSYSQMAVESIEVETELLESTTSPSAALSHTSPPHQRDRFHANVPVDLESVLAHAILSIYEYAQRGNLAKMRNRASQAYDAAIRLGLHDTSSYPSDECTEARRRAWWMTYVVVLQSSIVSNTPAIITIDFHQFKTPLPTTLCDDDAWSYFVESQQCILRCTQYTVALRKALDNGLDPESTLASKKAILDGQIDAILTKYSSSQSSIVFSSPTDVQEHTMAQSLRLQALVKLNSARIKLHRYRAFLDVPIFSRKHCDLDQADTNTPRQVGCSSQLQPSKRAASMPCSDTISNGSPGEIPFSDLPAAKTCLKSALAISRAFEALPHPNPMQLPLPVFPPSMMSMTSPNEAPRTMPAFACCAMQSCYVLLSLCYRSLERQPTNHRSLAADKGLEELYAGVARVLAALQNYTIAFEALNGMAEQVAEALEAVKCVK